MVKNQTDGGKSMSQIVSTPWSAIINRPESVADYAALRASTSSLAVLVTHSLTGGIFFRSPDQSTFENGGTRIRRTDGVYMDRVWDRVHIKHDWFPVGGVGVIDPGDQITAAANVGGDGCVIWGSAITTAKRCYITAADVTIDGIDFTRANQASSALTAAAAVGGSTVTVADGSVFRVSESITLSHVTMPNGGLSNDECTSPRIITAIAGNVLTLSGPIANAQPGSAVTSYPAGSLAIRVNGFLEFETTAGVPTVRNCKFHGNATSNVLRGWSSQGSTISLPASLRGGIIQNCEFSGIPGENIIGPNGVSVLDCRYGLDATGGLLLHGSFYHISDATPQGTEFKHSTIERCFGDGACQSPALNQHCDGVITYSANVFAPKIKNCRFRNGTRIIGSLAGGVIYSLGCEVEDCEFKGFNGVANGSISGTTQLINSKIRFTGCKFVDCGDTDWRGNNIYRGQAYQGITFEDCDFLNTRFAFNHCADVSLRNLSLKFSPGKTYTLGTTGGVNQWDGAAIAFLNFDRVNIENVKIDMPTTHSDGLRMGINLDLTAVARRRNAAGTELNVLYPQGVRVSNVHITGGRYQFTAWRDNNNLGQNYQVADWQIKNIVVFAPDLTHTPSGTAGVGILVPAGAICSGLHYRTRYVNLSNIPILAGGIQATSPALASQMGAIVNGWSILGLQGVNQVRNFSSGRFGSVSGEHVIASNGVTNSSMAMTLGTNTQVDAPKSVTLATLTAYAGEINHALFENAGVY